MSRKHLARKLFIAALALAGLAASSQASLEKDAAALNTVFHAGQAVGPITHEIPSKPLPAVQQGETRAQNSRAGTGLDQSAPLRDFQEKAPRRRWKRSMRIDSLSDLGISFLGFLVYVGIMVLSAFAGAAILTSGGGTVGAFVGLVAGAYLVPKIMSLLGF